MYACLKKTHKISFVNISVYTKEIKAHTIYLTDFCEYFLIFFLAVDNQLKGQSAQAHGRVNHANQSDLCFLKRSLCLCLSLRVEAKCIISDSQAHLEKKIIEVHSHR